VAVAVHIKQCFLNVRPLILGGVTALTRHPLLPHDSNYILTFDIVKTLLKKFLGGTNQLLFDGCQCCLEAESTSCFQQDYP